MAAIDSPFRYSNGEVATSDTAKAFSWENPVPVNPFWDSFEYCIARNFLGNFSSTQLSQLPIDATGKDDHATKAGHLLSFLKDELDREEAAASGSLFETNHRRWYDLWQAIFVYQSELDLLEAEETIRMLVARNPDPKSEVRPSHILAEYLVKVGKYKEAEETELPVRAWMDARAHLGRDSPQAINARRIIAKALWGQGPPRRAEAKALVAEIDDIVDGMGGGKFGVYQTEEKRLNNVMKTELENLKGL
ncbi:hypothetical protein CONLIGDRAFT_579742 [Coniochaeta ligniaria NRRL 30616]|uniref:Uncharacterized protein n=1 Tax=Coniochaeta ligniaria NRRL 30616 TaxID=1408157 RepID=A0A1J7JKD3_9PEZI|nr:hypothetical protein CONLIGDRAFT_579742 [Coniochaeta ligniaria NRRL 30616]